MNGLEPGNRDFQSYLLKNHFDWHPYLQIRILAFHNIAHQSNAFLELNNREIIGNICPELS